MSIYNDPQFIRSLILQHYESPQNNMPLNNAVKRHLHSSTCADDFTLDLILEGNVVKDIAVYGVGCAISTASASILTTLVKEKEIEEVKQIIQSFNSLMKEEGKDEKTLKEAIIFQNVPRQANRIRCALLAWRGLEEILNEKS